MLTNTAVIAHLVECEGASDHVTGETLAPGSIGSLGADAVVHRESGVVPLTDARCEIEYAFAAQKIQHQVAQRLPERVLRQGRQYLKRAREQKHAVGTQGMEVGLKVTRSPKVCT